MSKRHMLNSRISFHFLIWWVLFGCFAGLISSAEVTLNSIEIFQTHDWISKPTVYFACKGENKTMLPDVRKIGVVYTFKGEESWQPLTQLDIKKCKRCGFYEHDFIKADAVYKEWEFCAPDFKAPSGKYVLFKENQLNVTFHCQECASLAGASNATPVERNEEDDDDDDVNVMRIIIILVITGAVSTVTIISSVVIYKHWQKKKRQHDQARFLKLFEEGDDIEDELGLGVL